MAKVIEVTMDSRGRPIRDLGWKLNDAGKAVQHRFLLGHDRAQAAIRVVRLEQVWAAVEKLWQAHGRDWTGTEMPLWDVATLEVGRAVACGDTVARIKVPDWVTRTYRKNGRFVPNEKDGGYFDSSQLPNPAVVASVVHDWLERLRAEVPIRVELADESEKGQEEQVVARLREDGEARHLHSHAKVRSTTQRLGL